MVLAHEIAHVMARDPMSAVGGGATVALALALLSGHVEGLSPQVAEVVRLAAGLAVVVALGSAVLFVSGGWLAKRIPFAVEQRWVGDTVLGFVSRPVTSTDDQAVERYLQCLVDDLSARMSLPSGMAIRAHYTDLDAANAFATLGGHIVVTSGLYRRVPSENALAMVLAHEIAHVMARDPISAVGGGATVALALALLSGNVEGLTPHVAEVVRLGYSRGAETRADQAAIAGLRAAYGHAGGAAALFEILAEERPNAIAPVSASLLSSHPTDAERIARLKAAAADWDAATNPLKPLAPEGCRADR
jgi:Zn-dependent protease with chaperone function